MSHRTLAVATALRHRTLAVATALSHRTLAVTTALLAISCAAGGTGPRARAAAPETIRCAVIGGMVMTGFFPAVAKRFEDKTGHRVQIVITGNKEAITPSVERGEVDFVTMHASDTMTGLVTGGFVSQTWPWAQNELVIIGPPDDPAHVGGLADGAEAIRRIVAAKVPFVIPHSGGAREVLGRIVRGSGVSLGGDATIDGPEGNEVAAFAAARHAYTVVGRIPFQTGKIPPSGLAILVRGDPRLRRPYLAGVANPARFPGTRAAAAESLARFLLTPETQSWIADFARDAAGISPFYPIDR